MIAKIGCKEGSDPHRFARRAFDVNAGRYTRFDGSPVKVLNVTLSEDGDYAMVEIEGNELMWME